MRRSVAAVAGLVAILAVGCSKSELGLPRVALQAESPDGRHVALVRNHPALDPPSQSLWVGHRGESPELVIRLAEDMDWCDTIVWSADSSTVAFVVRGARLVAVEAATGETVFDDWVVEWSGEYPPAIVVRDLMLDATGSRATFRGCSRRGGGCQPGGVALRPGPPVADVVSVEVEGEPGSYELAVGISSPDRGCNQYADWWEVVAADGRLVYRRVLTHSHVNEQPFVRRGGPVAVAADSELWVRAHLHPTGYGGVAWRGSAGVGFEPGELPATFAAGLADEPPLPAGCAG